ncbi:helix-turn-helix domain-containing protein [Rhodococcus sovatensis]|uniref:Helix-turn-helix domain-containing protein n=1 Tax=Rhodococcus sovatensis TaxID=1805840 RepID=A0ABZ2PL02_9NOCA
MQGLMYRLAELDADSAGLVRVIDYFDALVRHRADTAAMMRASAALADCVVGMDVSGWREARHKARRCDPRGQWSPEPQRAPSSTKDIIVDDDVVGTVWIERNGPPLPLDDMLVDRMALTAAVILAPRRAPTPTEQTENLLFPVDEIAVLTSLVALGIEPTTSLRVAVSAHGYTDLPTNLTAGASVPVRVNEEYWLVLSGTPPQLSTPSFRVGVSLSVPANEIHRHLGNARLALTQASEDRPVFVADSLGALNLLGAGHRIDYGHIPDLVRAAEVGQDTHGPELIDTLRVYLRAGTLRAAADAMHLHHSSVAHRLTKLSERMGYAVDIVENRARATAMMMILDGTDYVPNG